MMDDFAAQVRRQVDKLSSLTLWEIEAAVAGKRLAWWRTQPPTPPGAQPPAPREAFERLFFDYLGLAAEDLPVIEETDERITWLSKNPCPTLDACLELGLDTRQVCRAAYEKSTQAFISQIDPQLRFLRSYQEIRPYRDHCQESIVRVDFEQMMMLAREEAERAREEGSRGCGALIVYGQQVIARARDSASAESDPGSHAEARAIRRAAQVAGDKDLCGSILFSTCEPCPVCAALAVRANVSTIVYGASMEDTARFGKTQLMTGAEEVIAKSPVLIEVIGNVLRRERTDPVRQQE